MLTSLNGHGVAAISALVASRHLAPLKPAQASPELSSELMAVQMAADEAPIVTHLVGAARRSSPRLKIHICRSAGYWPMLTHSARPMSKS